jgi:predicted outer membrane lipoprotein
MTELTSESITARVVTEGLGPATVMEGYVEYTAEDGRVLAQIPATVEIPDYVEPTEATEPSQTEPPEEDEPEEPKSSVNWFTLILGILLALAGGGVGAIWYSGYQALKKKVARIRQKIARLEEQDPESPVLPKLRKGAGAKVNFNGLYISAGLLALSIILLIVSF